MIPQAWGKLDVNIKSMNGKGKKPNILHTKILLIPYRKCDGWTDPSI